MILLTLLLSVTQAHSAYGAGCFDWNKGVAKPLKAAVDYPAKAKGKDFSKAGTDKAKNFVWGYARGKVKKPILKVYEALLDPFSVKDPEKVKVNVYPQEQSGYKDFQLRMVSVKKVPIPVSWEEEWAAAITEGTPEAPKVILIQNQRSSAPNKFLRHFCGTLILTADSANQTDVFVYEELDAIGRRSEADTEKGHLGTLATLRK
ncbi:MAG: hypothetical protein JNL01_02955 [Bdellovibrionales bacterium]|nr:hypothetical protein [Bdellovibrionales bacterium]